jgi:hypothetical protein
MSRLLCIGMAAALACACGRGDNKTADDNANTAARAGAPGATGTSGATATSGSNETITLTGCLERANANQAVGTSGTRAAAPRTDVAAAPPENADFILVRATAGAPDASGQPTGTTGVASNGAGASGGPIVTGTNAYVLEGGDLAGHEHQTVSITGHFPDPLVGGVLSNRPPTAASQDANAQANTGTIGSLTPNAKERAKNNTNANDVAHMRHVQVESVTMVAPKCSAK